VRHGVSPEPYVAWAGGRLVFDDTPLADVLAQLGRWYDVDARAADSVAARRRLTAAYSNEPLADILRLIAASLDLRVERHGRSVTFSARPPPPFEETPDASASSRCAAALCDRGRIGARLPGGRTGAGHHRERVDARFLLASRDQAAPMVVDARESRCCGAGSP